MANPTPRADALRQMREAKFEAEQKRLKQETAKPAEAPKRKPEPAAVDGDAKPAKAKAPPKAAKAAGAAGTPEVAEIATAAAAEMTEAAPAETKSSEKAAPKKAAPKKAAAKKTKASAK